MGDAGVDFKAKEKAVLSHLLTIPAVATAVRAQHEGRSQEAKALMRDAVQHFPREILEQAKAIRAAPPTNSDRGGVPGTA